MTVLNGIVADQLTQFKITVDELMNRKNLEKDDAIFQVAVEDDGAAAVHRDL